MQRFIATIFQNYLLNLQIIRMILPCSIVMIMFILSNDAMSAEVHEYINKVNITSMKDLGIRVHKKCCHTKKAQLYTCFSRFSPYYKEQPNLSYDKTKQISAENFPTMLVPGTVPYKLKNALQEMIDSGEIEDLKQKYSIE